MSFDYHNNKCLYICYSTGSFNNIEEFRFKQINDTLVIEDFGKYLIKENSIYMIGVNGKVIKKDKGLKLTNNKTISRLQNKFESQFFTDHLIMENSCIKRKD